MTVSPGQALKAIAMWGAYREVTIDRRVVAAAADIGSLWSARPVGVACHRRAGRTPGYGRPLTCGNASP